MKITRRQLRQIINEEVEQAVHEAEELDPKTAKRVARKRDAGAKKRKGRGAIDAMEWLNQAVTEWGWTILGASHKMNGDEIQITFKTKNKNGIEAEKHFYV